MRMKVDMADKESRNMDWGSIVGKVHMIGGTKHKIMSPPIGGEFSTQVSEQWNRLKHFFCLLTGLEKLASL
jgi:hypothetical protein